MSERKIAIISGRGLKDVMKKAGLKKLTYAGNHGLEIKGPGVKVLKAVPAKYKRALTRLKGVLVKKLSSIEGAFLEDKNFSVTVHYRQVAKKDIPGVKAVLREALDVPGVRDAVKVRSAKMAVEIRPPVEWDKGRAVLLLLSRQKAKLAGKKRKIIPIYAGDDATDEDAFRALRSVGVTISVGNKEGTSASIFLKIRTKWMSFSGKSWISVLLPEGVTREEKYERVIKHEQRETSVQFLYEAYHVGASRG